MGDGIKCFRFFTSKNTEDTSCLRSCTLNHSWVTVSKAVTSICVENNQAWEIAMLKSLDRKGAILFAMSLNILPGSGVFVAWVGYNTLTMERRNGRLLFVQKPNSCPKSYLAAKWHNKVMEIMQACISQQTLTKGRNVPTMSSTLLENVMLPSRLEKSTQVWTDWQV